MEAGRDAEIGKKREEVGRGSRRERRDRSRDHSIESQIRGVATDAQLELLYRGPNGEKADPPKKDLDANAGIPQSFILLFLPS